MQMSQVGREQAAEKEGVILQSAMKGGADQKRLAESKEAVRAPKAFEDGTKEVKDRQPGSGMENRRGSKHQDEAETEETPDEVVRDPTLGNRVDLSG